MSTEIDTNYISVIANAPNMVRPKRNYQEKKKQNKITKFAKMVKEGIFFSEETEAINNSNASMLSEEDILVDLQDRVHSTGDSLKKRVSTENILEYKIAVKNFINYVVNNAYDFNKANSRLTSFKKPKSSPIRVIDEKLERFAANLLSNQLSQLQILEQLEEIKGLLVDLLR